MITIDNFENMKPILQNYANVFAQKALNVNSLNDILNKAKKQARILRNENGIITPQSKKEIRDHLKITNSIIGTTRKKLKNEWKMWKTANAQFIKLHEPLYNFAENYNKTPNIQALTGYSWHEFEDAAIEKANITNFGKLEKRLTSTHSKTAVIIGAIFTLGAGIYASLSNVSDNNSAEA